MQSKRIMIVTSTGFTTQNADSTVARHGDVEFVFPQDNAEAIREAIPGCHALINCPRHIIDNALLRLGAPTLTWVHCGGAGVEQYLFPELVDSDIILTNGRVIQGPEVADHALALTLALTRNINRLLLGQAYGEMPRPIELRGKTCLVFGLGGIGLLVAERVKGFGMHVLGLADDMVPMVGCVDEFYMPGDLLGQLPRADLVICAAPSTEQSRSVFDGSAFDAMKQGAFFVNVSRGSLVVTDDLVAALEAGRLAGVGLDVTDPEPLPDDHPLRTAGNVLLTPHMAGPSDHNRQRSYDLVQENIRRFCAGETLLNIVDKRKGY